MSRAATASLSAPETALSVPVRSAPEALSLERLALTSFIRASSRSFEAVAASRCATASESLSRISSTAADSSRRSSTD